MISRMVVFLVDKEYEHLPLKLTWTQKGKKANEKTVINNKMAYKNLALQSCIEKSTSFSDASEQLRDVYAHYADHQTVKNQTSGDLEKVTPPPKLKLMYNSW